MSVSRYSVFEDGALKVSNVQFNDSAQYFCEVISVLDHAAVGGSITVVGTPFFQLLRYANLSMTRRPLKDGSSLAAFISDPQTARTLPNICLCLMLRTTT